MKKIPYGIINYEVLITEGYEYIDKTMYLEKLETVEKTLFYLRPGRFGKSLFTSMMTGVSLMLIYNLPFELINIKVADALIIIATILSVVSGVQYYYNNKKALFKEI